MAGHLHDMQALLERGGGYRLPKPLGDYIQDAEQGFARFRQDIMLALGPSQLSMRQREALFASVQRSNPLSLYAIYTAYSAQVRLLDELHQCAYPRKEGFMTAPKFVLSDTDDIKLDWCGGMARNLWKNHGIKVDPAGPRDWDMSEWMGVPFAETIRLIKEFNEEREEFGHLEPIPGAVEGIAALKAAGYLIVCVTSCSDKPSCVQRRTSNLHRVFGKDTFHAIHCVPLGQSKADYLKMYPSSPWIEDNYKNALLGLECGHSPIVRRVGHNAKFEAEAPAEVPFVDGWPEIVARTKAFHRQPALVN